MEDTLVFANQTFRAQSGAVGYAGFILKYDSVGNEIWARMISSFHNSSNDYCTQIDGDSLGNIYVTGLFTDTAHFGPFTLTAVSSQDVFVCKLDSGGNFKWAFRIGGGSFDHVGDIKVDKWGNTYITGAFAYNLNFGSIFLNGYLDPDIFVGKISTTGQALWAHRAGCHGPGGYKEDRGWGIGIDSQGNCYVTGEFRDTAEFETLSLISSGEEDIFIAKYSTDGNIIWARRAGGYSNFYGDIGIGIALRNDTSIFLNGYAVNGADFDNYTFHTPYIQTMFVSEFDSSGNFKRVIDIACTTTFLKGKRLLVNQKGETYFIAETDAQNLQPVGSYGFHYFAVIKLDSLFNVAWAKPIRSLSGGIDYDEGGIYFSGNFNGPYSIDGFNLSSNGGDIITGKFNDATNSISGVAFEDMDGDSVYTSADLPALTDSIYLQNADVYLIPDSSGFWRATVDTGSYNLINIVPAGYNQILPLNPNYYSLNFTNTNLTISGLDFGLTNPTGIFENQLGNSFQIFPNPLSTSSIIQFSSKLIDAEAIIYDLLGQELFRRKFSGDQMAINRCNLSNGIYFVRVIDNKKQFVQKLVVE
jgi:hypothetical protein